MTKQSFKHITILYPLLLLLLMSQSCVEERPMVLENKIISLVPMSLEISSDKVEFATPESGQQQVRVSSDNVSWAFTDIPDWIEVNPLSGRGTDDVSIQVSENPRAVNRVGLVTFGSVGNSWNYNMGITVSQYRAPYVLNLPVDNVQVDGGGGSITVKVDTNTDTWTIVIPSSMDWCRAIKTEDGLVVTATANTGNQPRSGKIELHTDDVSAFLTVTQRPAGVNVTTDRVDFSVEGGVKTIPLTIEAPWTVECAYSWIDIKTRSGNAGYVSIPMEVTPNLSTTPRDGFIYIVISDDNKIEIPVHQECIEFNVNRDTISFPSGGSTERLEIRSNVSWAIPDSITARYGWLTVDPMTGNGSTTVLIKANTNLSIDSRSFSLPIFLMSSESGTGRNIGLKEIEIEQDGRLFGADSTAIYFSNKAGSTYFNIKSDGMWLAGTSYPWITISPDYGMESGQVLVSVTENTADTTRIGYIRIVTAGQQESIPVYQSGRYIGVSSDALTFGSLKDSTDITLTTNGYWTAVTDQYWITLSATEGNGNCQILITAQDNPSTSSREGKVTITREDMNPVIITVNQRGRYLTVSTSQIEFFQEGGTSEPIIVQTDGNYGITTSADWITINKETASQFTLTVSENNASYRTGVVTIRLTDLINDTLVHNITVSQQGQPVYEYVDLGLSVYWATFNVGASAPEECGDYFAWGETEPYYEPGYAQSESPVWKPGKEGGYDWSSYNYCMGDSTSIIKYNLVDNLTTLEMNDDVANKKWGGDWRMPSKEEFEELQQYCSWELITQNGVKGYKVTSKRPGFENQSIFFPSCGARGYDMFVGYGEEGAIYWSNTRHQDNQLYAYAGLCDTSFIPGVYRYYVGPRLAGLPVRPVCPSTTYTSPVDQVIVNLEFNSIRLEILWGIDWNVEFYYNWDETSANYGRIGYSKPDLFKSTIYNVDNNGKRYSSLFKIFDSDGGRVILTPGGSYDMLFYPFGTEWTSFYQSEDYDKYTASTRKSSMNDDSYNQPDELLGNMLTGIELSNNPSDYEKEYDDNNYPIYVLNKEVPLRPYTFIYICQLIISNNDDGYGNRIIGAKGLTVSGLAQSVDLFTRETSENAVSISVEDIKPMQNHNNVLIEESFVDNADIIAARFITFGLPQKMEYNYMGIGLTLRNGQTYTVTRNITDQMHNKPNGGVITVCIDANDIPYDLLH